ncbi:MAG TPA: hypothetical protein DD726_01870 [Phycisphaerales bacterium]|nr:hypothetical protein [Phycisphaerales bacterium]
MFRQIVFFLIISLILSLLSGVKDTSGVFFPVARYFLGFLLILSFFLPSKVGVPLFFILILVGPDIIQIRSERLTSGEYNTASIWRLYLGPLRPSWIVAGAAIIHAIKNWQPISDKWLNITIAWFATVPILTGVVYGGLFTFASSIEVPADLRFALLLVIGVVLFRGFLKKYSYGVGMLSALFIGGILGRHLCDIAYWAIDYGPMVGGTSVGSVDTVKCTVVFLLLFAIYLIMKRKKIITGSILGILSVVLIIIYNARSIWALAAMCSMLLMFLYGAKKAFIAVPIVLILLGGSYKVINMVRTESFEMLSEKAESFTGGGSISSRLQRLDALRYAEAVDSIAANTKRMAILWGSGYGSYYRDTPIPFSFNLSDAHTEFSAAAGMYFYCHNFLFTTLFKYGVIGLIIILALWIGPSWHAYRYIFNRQDTGMLNGILGCFIAFTPTLIISLYYSGKGVLLIGFIIAIITAINEHYAVNEDYDELDTAQSET